MTGVSIAVSCLGTVSMKIIANWCWGRHRQTPIASVTRLLRCNRKNVSVTALFYTKLRISVINGDIKGHLLIIDLKRLISVFIREIYTINMKQKHRSNTVHGHGMVQKIPRERITFGANAVRSACGLGKQNQKYRRHESTMLSAPLSTNVRNWSRVAVRIEMEVRPSPVWHWCITILRCYLFVFRCWQLCYVKWFFVKCMYFSIDFASYMSVTVILWLDMNIW